MEEIIIDLQRLREALPDRAKVTLKKQISGNTTIPFIECIVQPSLSESDFEMCKNWQREIIGKENLSEFYTEEEGHHWKIYLKRKVISFENVSTSDINSFTQLNLVENGKVLCNTK